MTGWDVYESLTRLHPRVEQSVNEQGGLLVRFTLLILAACLLCGVLAALKQGNLREAARRVLGECGVPFVLAVVVVVLVSLPDGGLVDRYLSHLHWHIQLSNLRFAFRHWSLPHFTTEQRG